jgi:Lipocalin-like domain
MEMKTLWLFLGLALSTLSSHAAERTALVGVWQLISYQTEFQDGSPKRAMFGEHPTGYIIFTREGRLMAVIEAEGRKAPSTDSDRSTLLKTLIAYSGKYRIEGNQWIASIDTAWNPAWDGTDQVRSFRIVGNQLTVTSTWQPALNFPGASLSRGTLLFERVK